jgi:predicted glycosyl hydrolase (DUF1957 family)
MTKVVVSLFAFFAIAPEIELFGYWVVQGAVIYVTSIVCKEQAAGKICHVALCIERERRAGEQERGVEPRP